MIQSKKTEAWNTLKKISYIFVLKLKIIKKIENF